MQQFVTDDGFLMPFLHVKETFREEEDGAGHSERHGAMYLRGKADLSASTAKPLKSLEDERKNGCLRRGAHRDLGYGDRN